MKKVLFALAMIWFIPVSFSVEKIDFIIVDTVMAQKVFLVDISLDAILVDSSFVVDKRELLVAQFIIKIENEIKPNEVIHIRGPPTQSHCGLFDSYKRSIAGHMRFRPDLC